MKSPKTYIEFVAGIFSNQFKKDGYNFDNPDPKYLEWVEQRTKNFKWWEHHHCGDCTNQSCVCDLCQFIWYLNEFKEYSTNEEEWRKENLI